MCSDWLVFCDCGFHSVCPVMEKDERLMETDWMSGKLGLILMGGAMLSKSLIQFSVYGQGCVPCLLFDLRPNYHPGNEDNGDLLQKVPCPHCCTQSPQPCSRPLPTHGSARDSGTLMGKSGSVSCGVTAPFFGILVTQGFVCVLQESDSPALCKFWRLYGGVNGDLLQEGLCHTQVYFTQSPWHCLHRRHSNTVLAQSLWDPWVLVHTRFVWALWVSLVGMGFDSKCDFALPTILLGFLLCPSMWVSSSGGIQHSPVDSCSAASCNFGVLLGEDEHISFYSTILEDHFFGKAWLLCNSIKWF